MRVLVSDDKEDSPFLMAALTRSADMSRRPLAAPLFDQSKHVFPKKYALHLNSVLSGSSPFQKTPCFPVPSAPKTPSTPKNKTTPVPPQVPALPGAQSCGNGPQTTDDAQKSHLSHPPQPEAIF
jgi:hypothetical protein